MPAVMRLFGAICMCTHVFTSFDLRLQSQFTFDNLHSRKELKGLALAAILA